jgi:alginate O-acetyltransferase complex protein AlgI
MVFSSNIFLFLFLPAVLISYFFAPKNFRNYLLLIASLIFYSWGETQYIFLLIISIIGNYFFGIAVERNRDVMQDSDVVIQKNGLFITPKVALFFAIVFNLLILGYFKYANFIVENLNYLLALFSAYKIDLGKVSLPIGISFFTFHSISYIVDIYRGKVNAQKNIFDLALYISLFPQLVAGPIVRYNTIARQLNVKKRRHHPLFIAYGIRRFIIGLGKKVIIANPLGEIADNIFALPADQISFSLAWIGIICYTLQIFFDFSGYSDMAIGLARIFGFRFLENFNYPYISKSIKEFWRRWHISLSSWFRDYLYIPLGGNKCSAARQYFNLILVFFLCGFWHGASWNFIIWGLFHGFFLVLERVFAGVPRFSSTRLMQIIYNFIAHFYVLLVIMVGWVFFRSPDLSYSISYLSSMFSNFNFSANLPSDIAALIFNNFNLSIFVVAIIISMPVFARNRRLKNPFVVVRDFSQFIKLPPKLRVVAISIKDIWLICILILAIVRLAAGTHNPFIYFQF